jgi:hypothetical protein
VLVVFEAQSREQVGCLRGSRKRVSPHAAPLVLLGFAYAVTFRVIYQIGTGGGTYLYYLTATALGAILLGTERKLLTAALSAIAAGLLITVHVTVPYSTGLLSPTSLFVTFVTSVVVNTMLLFAVVRYAVGEMARAEAAAEREFRPVGSAAREHPARRGRGPDQEPGGGHRRPVRRGVGPVRRHGRLHGAGQ